MDWNSAPFGAIKQRMAWLDQRQQVIARNIANADTPGYVPHDLQPLRSGAAAGSAPLPMARTAASHLSGARPAALFREQAQPDGDVAPNGNAVDLEAQMARLHETGVSHKTASQLYRKYLNMVRMVASARG